MHKAGFAQSRCLGKHTDGGAVVPVPVEYFPAAVQQFRFIYFFNWHYTERSYGKGKNIDMKQANTREIFLKKSRRHFESDK